MKKKRLSLENIIIRQVGMYDIPLFLFSILTGFPETLTCGFIHPLEQEKQCTQTVSLRHNNLMVSVAMILELCACFLLHEVRQLMVLNISLCGILALFV